MNESLSTTTSVARWFHADTPLFEFERHGGTAWETNG